MKKWKRAAAAGLAAVLALALMGCSNKEFKEDGKLIVSTNAEFQPFEYMDGNKIVGIDVDMSTQIAKDLGRTLSIQNMDFNSVVSAVTTGKVDLGVAGLTKTAERMKSVDFSEPYYDASQVIIIRKDETGITGKDSLKGKKISVQQGTTGDDLATKITGDANVVRFNASTDAVTELKNGKVDAMIIDNFPANAFVKQNSDLTLVGGSLTSEKYCIAVRKGNEKLLAAVNKSIARLKSSGDLDQIVKKYS